MYGKPKPQWNLQKEQSSKTNYQKACISIINERRILSLQQCSVCGKLFPEVTLKEMIEILNGKAYYRRVCPACQAIVLNNPAFYYLHYTPQKLSSA